MLDGFSIGFCDVNNEKDKKDYNKRDRVRGL